MPGSALDRKRDRRRLRGPTVATRPCASRRSAASREGPAPQAADLAGFQPFEDDGVPQDALHVAASFVVRDVLDPNIGIDGLTR